MIFGLIQQRFNPGLRKTPPACIQRLFLTPYDRLRVWIAVQIIAELLPGERVQLFDTGDGCVLQGGVRSAVFVESGVDLTGAENDAGDVFRGIDFVGVVCRIRDYPLEVGLAGEVFDRGAGERVAEEGFGEEEDQSCMKGEKTLALA